MFVDTRPARDPRVVEQEKAFIQGTCPDCPTCGHRMSVVPQLQDTPWRSMNPLSPNWDAQCEKRLAQLRKEVDRRKRLGKPKYVCLKCRTHTAL